MGTSTWFSSFCLNIQTRNDGIVAMRRKSIVARLNTDFWNTTSDTAHSFYAGSYGRNTAIKESSDVDLIFELPASLYNQHDGHTHNGQSALLQRVCTSIKKTYNNSNIKGDGQVVVVTFSDGITFEVVPAFLNRGGRYTHPDTNDGGRWRITDPKAEIEAIQERNTICNNNLVPLCRMMRAWKHKWFVPIKGVLIDTLAYQFMEKYAFRNQSYTYYDRMSRDFFQWLADQDIQQEYWKAPGSGRLIYGKGLFQYKAKRCYNLSLEAIDLANTNPPKEWSAKQKWREIFGTNFPE